MDSDQAQLEASPGSPCFVVREGVYFRARCLRCAFRSHRFLNFAPAIYRMQLHNAEHRS